MAFPYLAEDGGETGVIDTTVWNGTNVDTQSKLAVRHFSDIYRRQVHEVPYRGAYAIMVDLSPGNADAYVESTKWARAAGSTIYTRFYLFVDTNLVTAAGDRITLFQLQSAGPVTQGVLEIRNNSGALQLIIAQTHASGTVIATSLVLGQYHLIELAAKVDSGANDGTLQLFVDGWSVGTLTGLTQAALTQARLGAMNIPATSTAGFILFDEIVADTTRIYGHPERFPESIVLTKSGFFQLGPCHIMQMSLMSGGAPDNHMKFYDANHLNRINAAQATMGPELTNISSFETKTYAFERHNGLCTFGGYVSLTGTNPRANFMIHYGSASAGQIASYAALWQPVPPF